MQLLARPEARALTQRMPETLRQVDPTIKSCLALLRALWQTDHAEVFRLLRTATWPGALQPLVQRFDSTRVFLPPRAWLSVN